VGILMELYVDTEQHIYINNKMLTIKLNKQKLFLAWYIKINISNIKLNKLESEDNYIRKIVSKYLR
jgi:hypothetical protein